MKKCTCRSKYSDELSRLELLTDLVEFARERREAGSPYTSGWADSLTVTNWMTIIGHLRTALPECAVKDFDDERERKRNFVESLIREHDRIS